MKAIWLYFAAWAIAFYGGLVIPSIGMILMGMCIVPLIFAELYSSGQEEANGKVKR